MRLAGGGCRRRIEGADPDDEVGEHFSARQVGAWIRTHEKDELADRWDWYERVQRALNGLVRDGRVHMGELERFRRRRRESHGAFDVTRDEPGR